MLQPNPWLICPQPRPTASWRLVCFPYAGGGSTIYRPWLPALHPDIELWAVRLPGRESRLREAPFTRVGPLLAALLADTREFWGERPFALFGHSLGALLAYEMAQLLRQSQMAVPGHLFVAGYPAPHLPNPRPKLHALPEDAFRRELKALGGIPEEIWEHEELLELLLPMVRADFAVHEMYVYPLQPPLDCGLTAVCGQEDPLAYPSEMEAWHSHTEAAFVLYKVPGAHFFLQSAQTILLRLIQEALIILNR